METDPVNSTSFYTKCQGASMPRTMSNVSKKHQIKTENYKESCLKAMSYGIAILVKLQPTITTVIAKSGVILINVMATLAPQAPWSLCLTEVAILKSQQRDQY